MADYYDSDDLSKFGDVGRFKPDLWAKFMEYYNHATGADGALTKREKALIALAVAHSKQCPYCIDAYTQECLKTGADPDQMTEAVHVASAMEAGMTLAHAIQMQNQMKRSGAI